MGRQQGNTITEYAIVIGLVGVLGITALMGLGNSVHKVFTNTSNQVAGIPMTPSGPDSERTGEGEEVINNGAVPLDGPGYYVIVEDPQTGRPRLALSDEHGSNTNATSVEGQEWSSLGSMMLAEALEDLASRQTDPAAAAWMEEMAKLAYYQAGTESLLEGQAITPFDPNLLGSRMNGQDYTNANAVNDLKTYQAQLKNMMENPPPGIGQADYTQAIAFASDAHNIAQDTVAAFSSQLDPNMSPGGAPFDQLLDLNTLKSDARTVLASSSVSSKSVETVLNSAVSLDGM